MDNYRFYLQEKNKYLSSCITVVYLATEEEIKIDALTSQNIVLYIKSPKLKHYGGKDINFIDFFSDVLFNESFPIFLRVASECMFGIFGDSHCDCESQRISSLNAINQVGQGIYIHLPHEAQGRGLFYKAEELALQVSGHDKTGKYVGEKNVLSASQTILGNDCKLDIRNYNCIKNILTDLGLNKYSYTFLTSNPEKVRIISTELGIDICRSYDVNREITIDNLSEILSKMYEKYLSVTDEELKKCILAVENASSIPTRVYTISELIANKLSTGQNFNCSDQLLTNLVKQVQLCTK